MQRSFVHWRRCSTDVPEDSAKSIHNAEYLELVVGTSFSTGSKTKVQLELMIRCVKKWPVANCEVLIKLLGKRSRPQLSKLNRQSSSSGVENVPDLCSSLFQFLFLVSSRRNRGMCVRMVFYSFFWKSVSFRFVLKFKMQQL